MTTGSRPDQPARSGRRRRGRSLLLALAVVATVATTGLVGTALQRPGSAPLGARSGPSGAATAGDGTARPGAGDPTGSPGASVPVGTGEAASGGAAARRPVPGSGADGPSASRRPGPSAGTGTRTGAVPGDGIGIAAGGTLQFDSAAEQERYLSAARDLGASWLRFDFTWNDIQRSDAGHYDWARYDALVSRAQQHGLSVLGVIAYPPPWARDRQCAGSQMCRPRDPAEYGRFAGAVAARYGPRGVHAFEIWNEPNITVFFQPAADAGYYTRMLTAASSAVRAADPRAVVVTGGTAPAATGGGNLAPLDFVRGIYAAGAQGRFDVLGHHPYCYAGSFDCPGTPAGWSAWTQMSGTGTSLRSLMAAHGDAGKKIWATEFGAPTSGRSSVDERQQARMLSTGVRLFSGYSWGGPLFLYSLRDRGTNASDREDWFGVLRADGSRKPAFGVVQQALTGLTG